MPSKNRCKDYEEGAYYHLYNRGVEKRIVFIDDQDYQAFIGLLELYLSPPHPWSRPHKDLSQAVELAAFCLMPNHFHLLVRQVENRSLETFGRCLFSAYVNYFNNRHNRVGSLFQDTYKAVRVTSDAQLYQVEQYIYLNPQPLISDVRDYQYSSYRLAESPPAWLKPVEGRSLPQGSSLGMTAANI